MKEQWLGSKESWDKIMAMGINWKQWKPGPMGSNSFFLKTSEGFKKVNTGDWITKDNEEFNIMRVKLVAESINEFFGKKKKRPFRRHTLDYLYGDDPMERDPTADITSYSSTINQMIHKLGYKMSEVHGMGRDQETGEPKFGIRVTYSDDPLWTDAWMDFTVKDDEEVIVDKIRRVTGHNQKPEYEISLGNINRKEEIMKNLKKIIEK